MTRDTGYFPKKEVLLHVLEYRYILQLSATFLKENKTAFGASQRAWHFHLLSVLYFNYRYFWGNKRGIFRTAWDSTACELECHVFLGDSRVFASTVISHKNGNCHGDKITEGHSAWHAALLDDSESKQQSRAAKAMPMTGNGSAQAAQLPVQPAARRPPPRAPMMT